MTIRTTVAVMHSGGLVGLEDFRVGWAAFLTPASSISAITGFRPGPTSPAAVTASGSADANVHIAPFQLFLASNRGSPGGVYTATMDAALSVNVLSTPADSTNPRNDLIIAQQDDELYGDADNLMHIVHIVGTPSGSPVDPTVTGSTDYVLLARVRVDAGAISITTPKIADLRPGQLYTVALGGILPVPNQAVRDALTGVYSGLTIWRIDIKAAEVYDATAVAWGSAVGKPNIQKFTVSGTWTKPTGAKTVVIECVGGGGAGGGAAAAASSQHSMGAGGGGGAYARRTVDASTLTATVTVTIGAGGTGVSAGDGNNGVATTFGAVVGAAAGQGGNHRGSEATSFGAVGGDGGATGSGTPDLVVPGSPGAGCWGDGALCVSGAGGSSMFGGGGVASGSGAANASVAGDTGGLYGGGGGGAQANAGGAAKAGGAGGAGVCIVTTTF